jgi:hypothetical protein
VFSPLDDELALLPGRLTPTLHGWLVRLSSYLPFAQASALLGEFAQVRLSEGTAQRLTYAAGTSLVIQQTLAAEQIIAQAPPPRPGPDCLLLSADGAMVPLVRGEWNEVKTLVAGVIEARPSPDQTLEVHTRELSSFSRLMEAESFTRLATVETFARGVERAAQVVAVSDGAEWIQRLFDLQCPDAVRILDFPHAAQRLSAIAAAVWGEGSAEAQSWQSRFIHTLKHEGPSAVMTEVAKLVAAHPDSQALAEHAAYLSRRVSLMDYPRYQAQGWPLASSCVESANKLVVEARLKGAGMHWARGHVNPMVALRNVVCNQRWSSAWAEVVTSRRAEARQARRERHQRRRERIQARSVPKVVASDGPSGLGGKAHVPAANHPWKRPALAGGARHNLNQRIAAKP